MKRYRLFIMVIFSAMFFSFNLYAVLTPDETKNARKTWMTGYDYFDRGEKALENGQLREAHTLFKESMRIFNKIKTDYPGWSSSMIEYRLQQCKIKSDKVDKLLAEKNIKITDDEVGRENMILKERVTSLEQELKDVKRKLDVAVRSLETARREAARDHTASAEIEKILKDKAELEKKYALLLDRSKESDSDMNPPAGETDEESRKAMDDMLLKIEALTADNKTLTDELEKERERFTQLAGKHTELKYEYKTLQMTDVKTQEQVKELSGKIAEHNEIIARWEDEKQKLTADIEEAKKALEESQAKAETLKNKLDEIRNNANGDAIAKQVENENEVLVKDMEIAHLQLAKELKEKKKLIEEKKTLSERVGRLEKALAEAVQARSDSSIELEALKKKMLISDTIIKKQDKTIADNKEELEKVKKEMGEMADKYRKMDKKDQEFTALAKSSLKLENDNYILKASLEKEKKKNADLAEKVKKSEVRMVSIQQEMQKLISEHAAIEKKSLDQEDELNLKITALQKQNKSLEDRIKTDAKKNAMLTEEIVALNTAMGDKDKRIAVLMNELKSTDHSGASAGVSAPVEPEIAAEASVIADKLRDENMLLKAKLKAKEKELAELQKSRKPAPEKSSGAPVADAEQIRKKLDAAISAENDGKKEAAAWNYEKVLALDPDNNTALSRLGYIEAGNGNYDDAVELLNRGLKNDPEDVEKLQVLAVCYIRQHKYYDALGAAAKANALSPKDPKTMRYLGIICSNLGWKNVAEEQFRSSFKLDPTSRETAFNAAVLLTADKKRLKDAKLWYDKAVKLGAERDPGIEKVLKTAE